ncbi:MAG: hypothetical protein ACU0DI_03430 [Paracoccaceae bacterium]
MALISLSASFSLETSKLDVSKNPHVWIDSDVGLLFGTFPDARFSYDFGIDELVKIEEKVSSEPLEPEQNTKAEISLIYQAKRITDIYEIETRESIYRVGSAIQALVVGLELIEELVPGTLEKLSKQKGRSKRPVSKERDQLYDMKSQMDKSERLKNGYWVATNNKASESIGYVRRAAQLAGLDDTFIVRKAG